MPRGGKRQGAGRKKRGDPNNDLSSIHNASNTDNSKSSDGTTGTNIYESIEKKNDSFHSNPIKDSNQNEPKEVIKEESANCDETSIPRGEPARSKTQQGGEKARVNRRTEPDSKSGLGRNSTGISSDPQACNDEQRLLEASIHSIRNGNSDQNSNKSHGETYAKPDSGHNDQRPKQSANQSGSLELTSDRIRILRESIADPARWCEWLWNEPLDQWQREAAHAFAKGERISRAACNGAGKTRLFAGLGSWNLARFASAKSIMTAGVYRQCLSARDELSRVMYKLGGWTLKEQELVHPSGTRFMWFAADNPGFFEGHHADYVALLIDEAKSVESGIYLASERLTANKKRFTFAASSPGGAVGWFYDTFTSKREFWNAKHISAYDIPRIKREWIDEQEKMHGKESSLFKSMILAEFTESEESALIKLEWVNRCRQTPPHWKTSGYRVAGIDLAGGGDDNVIVIRQGNRIEKIIAWKDQDTMRTAARIISELRESKVIAKSCFADAGGVGQGIIDKMAELDFHVNRIHFGGSPLSRNDTIRNRMTELWLNMKTEIEMCRIELPDDPQLIAELTSRRVKIQPSGKVDLESKEEMRRRGIGSPNKADALALALIESNSNQPFVFGDTKGKWMDYVNDGDGMSNDNLSLNKSADGFSLGRG